MYIYIHINIYIYIYTFTCLYILIHTYIYVHTYTLNLYFGFQPCHSPPNRSKNAENSLCYKNFKDVPKMINDMLMLRNLSYKYMFQLHSLIKSLLSSLFNVRYLFVGVKNCINFHQHLFCSSYYWHSSLLNKTFLIKQNRVFA